MSETKKKMKITPGQAVRFMTVTAMLSAVAYILMFFDFSVPFMPSFIKMDLSDLPELIGAFSMGPFCGVCVCLIKNLLHLMQTSTGGVGELSNFLLGVAFVLPGGLLYRHKKTKKVAILSSVLGAVLMGIISIVSNYYVVYPIYYNFMPKEAIIGAYNGVLAAFGSKATVDSILPCLIYFNAPFTIFKGLCSVIVTMIVYKPLSPILKGRSASVPQVEEKKKVGGYVAIGVSFAVVALLLVFFVNADKGIKFRESGENYISYEKSGDTLEVTVFADLNNHSLTKADYSLFVDSKNADVKKLISGEAVTGTAGMGKFMIRDAVFSVDVSGLTEEEVEKLKSELLIKVTFSNAPYKSRSVSYVPSAEK